MKKQLADYEDGGAQLVYNGVQGSDRDRRALKRAPSSSYKGTYEYHRAAAGPIAERHVPCAALRFGDFRLLVAGTFVPELAREIERARIEAGLSADDLLRSLREQRERYRREQYDDPS